MTAAEERSSPRPSIRELHEEFRWCLDNRNSDYDARARLNHDTRHAVWAGQTDDERRWNPTRPGAKVFPWPGASDLRCRLVDKYVREDAAMLMVLWTRMRTVVTPTEIGDAGLSSRLTQVLRWMKYTQMTEARREARLLANYLLERGAGVMGVFWDRREQLAYETVTMQQIAARAAMASRMGPAGQTLADLPAIIMDPVLEDQAVAIGRTVLPDTMRESDVRKLVRSLRETGEGRYPSPEVIRDRPTVAAFSLNHDIVLPPDMEDMDAARCVFWREVVSETTLKERERGQGWDEAWVREVISRGRGMVSLDLPERRTHDLWGMTLPDHSKSFEVVHAYRRLYDENGVPAIWYTVFSPAVATLGRAVEDDLCARHEVLSYAHGRYPFVLFEREVLSRNPDDSRGYGEVGSGIQRMVKVQWDSRVDRTSMATLPPAFAPPGRALDYWEPGATVETSRPDAYGFLEPPRYDGGSKEIEETLRRFADEYFGRATPDRDPTHAQLIQQDLANTWFDGWAQVDTMMLQLMQQFMPDEFYYRVVGTQNAAPMRASRREIQGKFDVSVSFNVANFNQEYAKEKMDLLTTMLSMDTMGLIDRAELLPLVADLIEPNASERLVRPAAAAAAAEISDEQAVFAQMLAGVQVDVKPGQNYELRKQVLEGLIKQNPTGQQAIARDPHVQEVITNRLKQLQQQLDQEQNKLVGVYGAMPSQQGPQAMQMVGGGR